MSTPGGWAAPGQEPPEQTSHQPSPAPPPGGPDTGEPPAAGRPPHTPAGGPPLWQAARASTYQPGVIPFRPLTLGDIYGATFAIIRGNPASTVGIALLLSLAALIPTTPLGLWVARLGSGSLLDPTVDPTVSGAEIGADAVLMTGGQLIPTIAGSLATIALAGFIAYVTGQAVLGRKVKLPETWRGTRPHLLRVIGVSLLISLIFFVLVAAFLAPGTVLIVLGATGSDTGLLVAGVLTLIVLGLLLTVVAMFLWTRLAFAGPAIVLEGMSIGGGIRRSWQLTRFRGFWRVLGIRLLTALLVSIVAQVLATPLSFVLVGAIIAGGADADLLITVQVIIAALTTLITTAATTPITATVDTLLYVDQRVRQEALDVRLIQAVEGQAPLPWQPALDPLPPSGA